MSTYFSCAQSGSAHMTNLTGFSCVSLARWTLKAEQDGVHTFPNIPKLAREKR